MINSSYGIGRYGRPTEADTLFVPDEVDLARPGVIYLHGAAGNAQIVNKGDTARGEYDLLRGLCKLGYVACAPDAGGIHTWSKPDMALAVEAVRLYMLNLGLIAPGPIHLVGASMGGNNLIGYYRDFPANVLSLSAIIPAWDTQDIRVNNRLNMRAPVDAAWGVVYPAPLPAGANPIADVANYVALGAKLKAWYANNDDVTIPGPVVAFAEAVGAEAIDIGALGHTQEAIAAARIRDVVRHMQENE